MSMYDSTDFASAEFARHPDGRIAARNGSGRRWQAKMPAGFWANPDNNLMAVDGWAPVLECPNPEQHDDRYVSPRAVKRVQEVQARAEKAERERDEARDAVSAAHHAMQEARERFRAAEPRPLSPDAITDEMVERVRDYVSTNTGLTHTRREIRGVLTAAFAEPTRLTELQVLAKVSAYMDEAGGEGIDAVTDFLAERGVRVVTEEGTR